MRFNLSTIIYTSAYISSSFWNRMKYLLMKSQPIANIVQKSDDGFHKNAFQIRFLFSRVNAFLSESILYICSSLSFSQLWQGRKSIHCTSVRLEGVSKYNNGFKIKGHRKRYLLWLFQFKTVINVKKTMFKVSYHEWMLFCSVLTFRKRSVSASSSDSQAQFKQRGIPLPWAFLCL